MPTRSREMRPDPVDGRAKLVTLTDMGRRCVDAALRTIADIERDLDHQLGPELLRAMREALVLIVEGTHGSNDASGEPSTGSALLKEVDNVSR